MWWCLFKHAMPWQRHNTLTSQPDFKVVSVQVYNSWQQWNNKVYIIVKLQEPPVAAVEPHRLPMTNVGTKTAFRHGHCKHFQKSKHLLGSEVSWCDHRLAQTPKQALSRVRVHAGTTQVDFEVDCPPPADSPPGDLLITMVKKTVMIIKKSFEKMKKVKLVRISHWSDSDENAIDCQIAFDCVKRANVVVGRLRKVIFTRTHTATHKLTSAQRLKVTTMTHTRKNCS